MILFENLFEFSSDEKNNTRVSERLSACTYELTKRRKKIFSVVLFRCSMYIVLLLIYKNNMLEKNKSGKTQDFNFWLPSCPTVVGNNYRKHAQALTRRLKPTYCRYRDHNIFHHSVCNDAEKSIEKVSLIHKKH